MIHLFFQLILILFNLKDINFVVIYISSYKGFFLVYVTSMRQRTYDEKMLLYFMRRSLHEMRKLLFFFLLFSLVQVISLIKSFFYFLGQWSIISDACAHLTGNIAFHVVLTYIANKIFTTIHYMKRTRAPTRVYGSSRGKSVLLFERIYCNFCNFQSSIISRHLVPLNFTAVARIRATARNCVYSPFDSADTASM